MNILLIFCISVTINSVIGCSNIYNIEYKCPDDYPVFDRPPVDEYLGEPLPGGEYNTTKWCIGAAIFNNNTYAPDGYCFKSKFLSFTAPKDQMEMDFAVQKTKETMINYGLTIQNWTLLTDGWRISECLPPNSCPVNESYTNTDFPYSTPYMVTHWMPGEPDNEIFNGQTKDCVGFNQDGLFRSIFCGNSDSPILGADGKPEYTYNGVFCAFPATQYKS